MKRIFLFTIVLISCLSIQSQNIFDFEHSLKFANHLYKNRQYAYAAQEFDRLSFMQPGNDSLVLWKIQSVAKANEFAHFKFDLNQIKASAFLAEAYSKLLLESKQFEQSFAFIEESAVLNSGNKSKLLGYHYLLQADLINAKKIIDSSGLNNEKINSLMQPENYPKFKSPALATTFSMLLPGSGKFYTGYYRDGLTSFLLVAVNAWQAYDGFQKLGKQNVYPWFFVFIGGSFYLGNIYGSFHSAKIFNQQQHDQFCQKAQEAIFSDL